jgi:hypothetical protein
MTMNDGRRVTIQTTRMSVISGSERNGESRKAMNQSPGAPSDNATPRAQSAILPIE